MTVNRCLNTFLLTCLIWYIFLSCTGTVIGFAPRAEFRIRSVPHILSHSDDMTHVIEYDDFLPNPHADLDAVQVVEACMNTMLHRKEAGLEVCWNFSSDRCRAALGDSFEAFREYSTNPVFSYLVNCRDWKTVSVGPVIQGTPTRGAMQTVLIDVFADGPPEMADGRRFLWTLQKERRPPLQGCYLVHECIYVRNAYDLTL